MENRVTYEKKCNNIDFGVWLFHSSRTAAKQIKSIVGVWRHQSFTSHVFLLFLYGILEDWPEFWLLIYLRWHFFLFSGSLHLIFYDRITRYNFLIWFMSGSKYEVSYNSSRSKFQLVPEVYWALDGFSDHNLWMNLDTHSRHCGIGTLSRASLCCP